MPAVDDGFTLADAGHVRSDQIVTPGDELSIPALIYVTSTILIVRNFLVCICHLEASFMDILKTATTYQTSDAHNFVVVVLKPFTSMKLKYFIQSEFCIL